MITERQSFLSQIADNPGDDGIRLIYADWCEDQGDEFSVLQAELIRVQCALASLDLAKQELFKGKFDRFKLLEITKPEDQDSINSSLPRFMVQVPYRTFQDTWIGTIGGCHTGMIGRIIELVDYQPDPKNIIRIKIGGILSYRLDYREQNFVVDILPSEVAEWTSDFSLIEKLRERELALIGNFWTCSMPLHFRRGLASDIVCDCESFHRLVPIISESQPISTVVLIDWRGERSLPTAEQVPFLRRLELPQHHLAYDYSRAVFGSPDGGVTDFGGLNAFHIGFSINQVVVIDGMTGVSTPIASIEKRFPLAKIIYTGPGIISNTPVFQAPGNILLPGSLVA